MVALGSNMKVVTASHIHKLIETTKLHADTPVNSYLKSKIKHGDKVTIRQLLCHTSGLPNIFGEGEFKDYHWEKASSKSEMISKINSSKILPKLENISRDE